MSKPVIPPFRPCFAAAILSVGLIRANAATTPYYANQQANTYVPGSGGVALTGGGNVGPYRDPGSATDPSRLIQSANGSVVLRQSAIAAAVVAFPEGMANGYSFFVAMGNSTNALGTIYKTQQNGTTHPWDLRFPGVVQLDDGTLWSGGDQNFNEATVQKAAEYYRVAIRANPFDLRARTNLISTYKERMVAHIFAGNNGAQYASGHRLAGGSISDEIHYWTNAIAHYQASGDILVEATGVMPDAATFESPVYGEYLEDSVEVFARGLAYEAEAVRNWLQLSYFASYRDPLSTPYSPNGLLASLQPKLDHLQGLLFFSSEVTHVPNYLTLDFPSVHAALAFLNKQRNTSIPLGMLSFVGSRGASAPGEVAGEYAPEYIPFLYKDTPTSLPTSFENLLAQADELIGTSKDADDVARSTGRAFDTDRAQLTARMDELFKEYNSQLGDLCGLIYGDDNELHPDVIGSLLPPGDREFERPFRNGESPGRIYQQHLVVAQTVLEVEAAEQDRHNIYLKAENAKTVGELIANQHENLAQMYLTNGASFAALERMRGEETARIDREIAYKQWREAQRQQAKGIWSGVIGAVGLIGAGVLTALFPPAGVAAAAAWAAGGGLFAAGAGAGFNTWAQSANAHGNAALILETGELQAQLAEINSEIDAQKEEIRALEAATVQFAERDAALWKTEEAWQAAMLDYERSALNVMIAEQRLLMQRAELANLHTRAAYLLQEMRKAIVLNTQTLNPLARPDYRLWMDYVNRYADEAFLRAQEWLYLAAKAAQYKVNSSASVSDISGRIEAILRARRGNDLLAIRNALSTDLNALYLNQGTPTTALPIPLRIRNYVVQNNSVAYNAQGDVEAALSLFETQLSGLNTVAASDAAWLAFLEDHVVIDYGTFSVRLEIPFSTSLQRPNLTPGPGFDPLKVRQNPLFSPTRYSDLISYDPASSSAFGVRVNIRGRGLSLDPNQSVVARLRQVGASYLRTTRWAENPRAFRVWNLNPVDGLISCSVNSVPAGLRTPQFHERSPANDHWILVIDTLEGAGGNNAALLSQLQNITDIEITFSIKGFTN